MQCVNFDDIVNGNKNLHNKNWSYIPDHPYRILIIGGSESGKSNALLKLIENLPINKREGVGINHFNDHKSFIEYSNDMCHVYKNINHYNPDKENKILIVFDDMIQNKKLNSIVTELFIRGRKLNISLAFITQSYFKVPKDVRLNTTFFLSQKV